MKKLVLISALFFSSNGLTVDEDLMQKNSDEIRPQKFKITTTWITMSDGVRLAADLYWPKDVIDDKKFPILLEYLPYRKDESRARNYALYSYFLENGYIVARVDIRGTGNSEGITVPHEYSDIELDDGEEVIEWLSKQDWSTGKIGMFGISWGGFNSIQMAMRNPPALKAFISVMATDYLYQEDVHYMDGIMVAGDSWMMRHDLDNSIPGAPEFKMDDEWIEKRFDVKPSVFTYMRQQRDGAFWDRASAKGQYHKIKIPGYHIGGWYDGYRNSLLRMLENVEAPVKAMIGPWDHYFPHNAWPEPQVEWRYEAVRWFDHWLKEINTGIQEEPKFAVFVRNYHPPDSSLKEIDGFWRWEDDWPIKRIENHIWHAHSDHSLAKNTGSEDRHHLEYRASSGVEGGGPTMWWGSIPPDQKPMDELSLVYDSEVLDTPFEILGRPVARLRVSATAKRANWVVRISDIAPDGQVTQVAAAAFNGTHRNSARNPDDIIPGEEFNLNINLHFTSWVFQKGHRIRVAVNNAIWPMLWPTPFPMETKILIGGDHGLKVEFPVIPFEDKKSPNFKQPSDDPMLLGYESLDSGNITGYAAIDSIEIDPETGEAFGVARNGLATKYPWGIERYHEEIEHRTSDSNPALTSVVGKYKISHELKDRILDFHQNVEITSDEENFYLVFHRWVLVNGELFREKVWEETIQRDFQ